MTATLAALYRHPVKSLGAEALERVALTVGAPLPWDRVWAVAHGASDWRDGNWAPRGNFVAQAHVPECARITVGWDAGARRLTLAHPLRPAIALDPDTDEGADALTGWLAPLAEGARPGPYLLARRTDGAMTDMAEPWVSILSTASLRALEQVAGASLAHVRFRGNVWLDGLAPWEEFDLVGREIALGTARLRVVERIERCNAPAASPETGTRDVPVTSILARRWGHRDFGVYAEVIAGGEVALGDPVA